VRPCSALWTDSAIEIGIVAAMNALPSYRSPAKREAGLPKAEIEA
jgi:hypothetical protein